MKNPVASSIAPSSSGAAGVKRPRILGVAHIALYTSDLEKARVFYKDFLGFEEPFCLKGKDGNERIAFIKVNDNQYIELFAEAPRGGAGQLNHISFYTDDAHGMRDYLASRGVKVPGKVGKGRTGNTNFNVTDPDGHVVETVQYEPDSWTSREKGRFMPDARISFHVPHLGVLVGALEPAMRFYKDVLGFQETWRGGSPEALSWVNMRVPDGEDYVEFMLCREPPAPQRMGVKNHLCLAVAAVAKAIADLEARPARKSYGRPIEMQVGKNRRRQANLFDPDGTRIELMEPGTIDGKPVPSSTAPAPR